MHYREAGGLNIHSQVLDSAYILQEININTLYFDCAGLKVAHTTVRQISANEWNTKRPPASLGKSHFLSHFFLEMAKVSLNFAPLVQRLPSKREFFVSWSSESN
jgi:hypothetical protein